MSHALQGADFDVRRAATWVEAVDWLNRAPFQVLIISAALATGKVGEMTSYVAAHHPGTAVILLADADDARALARECGSQAVVVPKPLDLSGLVQMASESAADRPVARRA